MKPSAISFVTSMLELECVCVYKDRQTDRQIQIMNIALLELVVFFVNDNSPLPLSLSPFFLSLFLSISVLFTSFLTSYSGSLFRISYVPAFTQLYTPKGLVFSICIQRLLLYAHTHTLPFTQSHSHNVSL